MSADAHRDRVRRLLAIDKSPEPRIGVPDQPLTFDQTKLGMATGNHRPLFLRKEKMTNCRVAPDQHCCAGEGALTQKLATTIFCENDFHGSLECGDLSPLSVETDGEV
jgi:hypothetical protein